MALLELISNYDQATYAWATKQYERTALWHLLTEIACVGMQTTPLYISAQTPQGSI